MTGIGRAIRAKKLIPRFIGPFQILSWIGPVAYQIALPPHLSNLLPVFHVSQLRKYVPGPSHIIGNETVQVRADLTFKVRLAQIIDRNVETLRNKAIPLVKVIWEGLTSDEATWEKEDDMKAKYPELFE